MRAVQSLSILVIDDQQRKRSMARQVLRKIGVLDMAVSASGEAALKLMNAKRFDVVISGLNLPGLSGPDLARKIKADPALSTTPVFLATSDEDRHRANEAVDHFLSMPFTVSGLRDALEKHLGKLV